MGGPQRLTDTEQLEILALLKAASTEDSAMRAARALADLMRHLHALGDASSWSCPTRTATASQPGDRPTEHSSGRRRTARTPQPARPTPKVHNRIDVLSCRRSECLLWSYDAVNVLPCSTWSYLTGGPVLTALPFQDDAQFSDRPPGYGSGGARVPQVAVTSASRRVRKSFSAVLVARVSAVR